MSKVFAEYLKKAFNRYNFNWPGASERCVFSHPPGGVPTVQFYYGLSGESGEEFLVIPEDDIDPSGIREGEKLTYREFVSTQAPTPRRDHVEGYELLADVLTRAYMQCSSGKGKERHATALPFHEQPIVHGAKDYGVGGPLFQVGKKSREAFGMVQRGERDKAVHELLGAIVYAAGAIVAIEDEGE